MVFVFIGREKMSEREREMMAQIIYIVEMGKLKWQPHLIWANSAPKLPYKTVINFLNYSVCLNDLAWKFRQFMTRHIHTVLFHFAFGVWKHHLFAVVTVLLHHHKKRKLYTHLLWFIHLENKVLLLTFRTF